MPESKTCYRMIEQEQEESQEISEEERLKIKQEQLVSDIQNNKILDS